MITLRRLAQALPSPVTSALSLTVALSLSLAAPAHAFRIELKDVAPDRIERQRAAAIGHVPLPGTPNVAQFEERLKEKGLTVGAPMLIRVFKAESELEVWMQKGNRYELFATYPVCHWSGTLGPKISEGDKQSPEGVYTVTQRQLHMVGRHPRSLNLGFPNSFDRQFQRTGSYILIHGACGSVGCFAMTNPVIEEIFSLTQAALRNGQDAIQVHAFPFRMSEQRLQSYALHEWYDFWRNLKDVYDAFEKTKLPPQVSVCEGRYWVDNPMAAQTGKGEVASQGPLVVCGAEASSNSQTASVSRPLSWGSLPPISLQRIALQQQRGQHPNGPLRSELQPHAQHRFAPQPNARLPNGQRDRSAPAQTAALGLGRPRRAANPANPRLDQRASLTSPSVSPKCEISLPSCRKWVHLQSTIARRLADQQARGGARVAAVRSATPRRP